MKVNSGFKWAVEFLMQPPVDVRNIADMDLVEIRHTMPDGTLQKIVLTRTEAIFLEGVLRGARRERENGKR
jgi:hypothetical protein